MIRRTLTLPRLIQLAFVVALFASWHFATTLGGVSNLFLPRLGDVWRELWGIIGSGRFIGALSITVGSVAIAYSACVLLGLVVGYAVTRSSYLMRVFEPIFSSLFAIPMALLFPLFILFFGIGPESKIALGISNAFFPIVLNTIIGFGYPDRRLVNAARSMGASRWQLFWRVLLPGALPTILTGLRMGFFICVASVLAGEALASFGGLGREISHASELMETARMYAWILFAITFAFSLTFLITHLESLRRTPGHI